MFLTPEKAARTRPVKSSTSEAELGTHNWEFDVRNAEVARPRPGFRTPYSAAPARIDPLELRRKAWHMLPGLLPFVLMAVPHRDPLGWVAIAGILATTLVMVAAVFAVQRTIRRSGERDFLSAVIGYAIPAVAMILLFPAHIELGLTVAAVIAFGDGAATIAGLAFPRRPLPWNRDKTWAGLVAFIVCAIPLAAVVYWGEARPAVPFQSALLIAAVASVVAAIAESLRARLNDNIRVGVAAALMLIVAQSIVIGW